MVNFQRLKVSAKYILLAFQADAVFCLTIKLYENVTATSFIYARKLAEIKCLAIVKTYEKWKANCFRQIGTA